MSSRPVTFNPAFLHTYQGAVRRSAAGFTDQKLDALLASRTA